MCKLLGIENVIQNGRKYNKSELYAWEWYKCHSETLKNVLTTVCVIL